NCPGQIVISGTKGAIARAQEAWASQKKRAALLATAGAFHSPLMQDAADEFATYLSTLDCSAANIPLICNVDARPLERADVREHLVRHLVEPVRFDESVLMLAEAGATEFIEVGFGGVLMGLVKRIDKNLTRSLVADASSFETLVSRWKERDE
ncbi:MAG: acyltransferase domain-containing protein, partial [Raoultibacter sp.]